MASTAPEEFDSLCTDELLTHVRSGDQDAWREVYRRFRPYLSLAAREHANLGIGEADDVIQSCFLSVWSHIEDFEYRGKGSFRAWLRRVVINKNGDFQRRAARWLRRRNRDQGDTRSDSWWLSVCPDRESRTPQESLAIHDAQERLVEQMSEILTPEEQELIILRYFEELPMARIIEVMEISRGALRHRHRTAIAKMARILEDEDG